MKVTDLAQTSGVIANFADKLLNRFLPQENAVAASCPIVFCFRCVNRVEFVGDVVSASPANATTFM